MITRVLLDTQKEREIYALTVHELGACAWLTSDELYIVTPGEKFFQQANELEECWHEVAFDLGHEVAYPGEVKTETVTDKSRQFDLWLAEFYLNKGWRPHFKLAHAEAPDDRVYHSLTRSVGNPYAVEYRLHRHAYPIHNTRLYTFDSYYQTIQFRDSFDGYGNTLLLVLAENPVEVSVCLGTEHLNEAAVNLFWGAIHEFLSLELYPSFRRAFVVEDAPYGTCAADSVLVTGAIAL